MYSEENTYDDIVNRSLERVRDDIDKREGSIIYDSISPFSAEIAQAYILIDTLIDLVFVNTSVGQYLDRLVEQQAGIYRNVATKAIRKGIFYDEEQNKMDVEIGSTFSIDELHYIVTEKIDTGEFKLECTTAGKSGNQPLGILLPLEYNIKNLGLARITDILIPGEDEETDEELRKRFNERKNENSYAGNPSYYKMVTKEIEGVGAVKVIPVWAGGGTVKLIILDSDYNVASDVLVENVQKIICPNISDKGEGKAPIGHRVTITTPVTQEINVKTKVALVNNEDISNIQQLITNTISEYLLELRKEWEKRENLIVRISQIEARILNLEGILDVTETTINDQTSNLEVTQENLPGLGNVEVQL